MIVYIFSSPQTSWDAGKNIKKALRNKARFNRMLTAFTFTMTAYALKKIEKLNNEIKELKRMKGA